jgi:aminoglycoside phosphotransferase (APT) family kinase protein
MELVQVGAATRRALSRELVEQIRNWDLTDPVPVGEGYDFDVYRARAADGSPVVLRVARRRFSGNAHDPFVDSRQQLEQEFVLADYLTGAGFPVARPRRLALDVAGTDVLVSDYIPDDGGELDSYRLGQQVAQLHALRPATVRLVAGLHLVTQEGLPFEVLVPTRLVRWWHQLRRLVPDLPDMLPETLLRVALARRRVRRLLHLDVRRPNLRCVGGGVAAFIDWSNAILGDPPFELARIEEIARLPENGLDPERVRAGYGRAAWRGVPELVRLIYKLDAAVMLALLFTAEEPGSPRGPVAVERALVLHSRAVAVAAREWS